MGEIFCGVWGMGYGVFEGLEFGGGGYFGGEFGVILLGIFLRLF